MDESGVGVSNTLHPVTAKTVCNKLRPTAKSGSMPVLTNKVLLEHRHAHLFTYCLQLLSCSDSRVELL